MRNASITVIAIVLMAIAFGVLAKSDSYAQTTTAPVSGQQQQLTPPMPEPMTGGELPTDDPPLNFRVTGYGHDWIGMAWAVPRDRGLTNYVLQRYEHNGDEFVSSSSSWRIEDDAIGGAGYALSNSSVDPDTLYKYTLTLRNASNETVIEASVTARTLPEPPPVSTDATLSGLALSGITLSFDSSTTEYTARVSNDVAETTVTPTVNDDGARYLIKLGRAISPNGDIPLAVGANVITIKVTAEDDETTKTYTVTVTRARPPATLSALALSGVTLSFNWATTQYTPWVPNDVAETTVTPTVYDEGASHVIKLNGATDADGVIPLSVGRNAITIEVTTENGNDSRTYTVTVTRAEPPSTDATLSGLALSGDTLWSPSFDPPTTHYAVQVALAVTQTTVTPTLNDDGASYVVKLGGLRDYDHVIPLAVGRNVITIEVTAEDGETTKTYTIAVTRTDAPEPVTGELPTDDPPVNFRVTGYGHDWTGMAWAVPRDRGITNYVLQRYEHNGEEFVSSSSSWRIIEDDTNGGAGYAWSNGSLEPDTLYKYVLTLTNAAGITIIEKSVTVRTTPTSGPTLSTDATLSGLALSGIDFGAFSSGRTWYSASVANDVMETTVTPTVNHNGASYVIKLGGVIDDDGIIPLAVGSNAISVVVTAEDGTTTKVYVVTVTRSVPGTDATLSALTLSGVTLSFDWATTQYTAEVANHVVETTVTPTVSYDGAGYQIKLNGVADDDGVVPLSVGDNVITIEVTAAEGNASLTYTVTVTRAPSADATLRSLTLSGVTLSFHWATTQYSARVANEVDETAVTPTVSHQEATYVIKLGSVADDDGVIPLAVGSNVITIEVTAEDGSTTRTYTVTVTRLVVTGELSTDDPPVNFRVTGYGHDWTSMAWAVPRDRGITNYVLQRYEHNGEEFVSSSSSWRIIENDTNGGAGYAWSNGSLEPDTLYKYVLTLTNAAGITIIEKSVTVRTTPTSGPTLSMDATLSGLTLSGIDELEPLPYRSTITHYTAGVAHSMTQTTVTARVNHSGASYVVKLGGLADEDGIIPLGVGKNVITVEVTAEDGIVSKIYTVVVTRGPVAAIELSPTSPVTEGTEVTVDMSFANLPSDNSANLVFRADVLDSNGIAADACEGNGLGVGYDMGVVDEDPETRTGAVSSGCPPGDYTIEVTLASANNVELASAGAAFSVLLSPGDSYDANGNGVIDKDEAITAVSDYFNGVIAKEEAIAVVLLYFSG